MATNRCPRPPQYPQGSTTNGITGLTYGQGKFLAVGFVDTLPPRFTLHTSTDGINWTSEVLPIPLQGYEGRVWDVRYVPEWDRFVLVGENGLIGTSPDGHNWTFRAFANVGHLMGMAYGNGAVVAGSWSRSTVLVSTDGQNWRIVVTGCDSTAMSVAFGGGIFAHTSAGALCTSP